MSAPQDLRSIANQFRFRGEISGIAPHGNGHINETYLVTCGHAEVARFILQRINRNVFRDPAAVMENIERVTAHLAAQLLAEPDRSRRVLTLIPAKDGLAFHVGADGEFWRAYQFVGGAHSCETVESPRQAFQAARAFGHFQQQLATLPATCLRVTIPDFHNTPKRYAALNRAIASDVCNRAALAEPEIAFALAHESISGILLNANLPERVTHNDTKLNNVLFDDLSGEALCVIDLDTVMPGLALYDFGDMVRTTTSPADEDERDLSRVQMQLPVFEALLRGYLSSAGEFLTKTEHLHLVFSGKLITFEMGIRFLTDFLNGDTYYKVHRPQHNLDRCRTQFKLVESIEKQEEKMSRLVESIAK